MIYMEGFKAALLFAAESPWSNCDIVSLPSPVPKHRMNRQKNRFHTQKLTLGDKIENGQITVDSTEVSGEIYLPDYYAVCLFTRLLCGISIHRRSKRCQCGSITPSFKGRVDGSPG